MTDRYKPLLERGFLHAELEAEYAEFRGSPIEQVLFDRLTSWSNRYVLGETQIEGAFIGRFFEDTWGYPATAPIRTTPYVSNLPSPVQGRGAGPVPRTLD